MRKFTLGVAFAASGLAILVLVGILAFRPITSSGSLAGFPKGKLGATQKPSAVVPSQPIGSSGLTRAAQAVDGKPQTASNVAIHYNKLPLSFEPNLGQTNKQADFFARGDGYILFLNAGGSTVVLKGDSEIKDRRKAEAHDSAVVKDSMSAASKDGISAATRIAGEMRIELVGASEKSHSKPVGELPGKSNYLIGKDPANWRTNIPNYQRVEQEGVYPGVDLAYYGSQRQIEFDFTIAPRTDPSVIQMAFRGAKRLRTDLQGDLIVTTSGREVRLHKPVAYQESGASKEMVSANYALTGENGVAFQLGHFDPSRPLVIDPILSYSTYVGGSNIDGAYAIAVAPDKTAFITGGTYSLDFPTVHPLQPNHGGPDDFYRDAFVSKLSADGSTLLYSTYLGGKFEDVGYGIAVDALGDAYVTGSTESPDFPVPSTIPSFDPECGGDGQCGASFNPGHLLVRNGFVIKLNPQGTAPLYSTFIGYYSNVIGQAIAVDENQIAYITGNKGPDITPTVPIVLPNVPPPPFPVTGNAAQPAYGGGTTNAFLWKLSASGNSLLYCTYIGGSNEDIGLGIAVDANATAFVTGLTYSTDFPVAGSAIQSANAGAGDAFLTKINTDGGPFVYSTFLGGTRLDQGNSVAIDGNGNAYVTGGTVSLAKSLGFTPPPGAFQTDCALDSSGVCEGDAFIAKINSSGSLNYFTYLGGSLADEGFGIAIDTSNSDPQHPCLPSLPCAVVTGSTVSTDFIPPALTATAFQPKYGGGNADAFVTKLDGTGGSLIYSSYLGGTNTDVAYGIAVDTGGNAYVAGQTCSLDFPLANPEQPAAGGNCDAFVSKISILHGLQLNPAGLVFNGQSLGTASQPQTVTVTNGDAPQTVSSPTLTGPNASDFQMVSTCGASLSPGAQCTVSVTFTPTATATAQPLRKGQVNIVCPTCGTSGITYVLNLTGQLSNLTLSASSLTFSNQQVGVVSGPMPITATNIGTTAIAFSSITASGDYAESDDCTRVPLQPTTNCVINVTFAPITAGLSVGALTLTDSASGSPQIILLTGAGVGLRSDFAMSLTPPSAAVSAGQSANFTLLVTSFGGFKQPVTLSCAGLPRNANCEAASNQVTPASPATPFPLLIATGLRTNVPPGFDVRRMPWRGLKLLVIGLTGFLAILLVTSLRRGRMRLATASFGFAVILLFTTAGCSSGSQAGVPAGTPAGTYQVTVVGTSGSITHSTTLNLQVN